MIVDEITALIKGFNWHNYGLDLVEETKSDDWAQALAQRICSESGYVMLSHDVYLEMTRTAYGMATCTHPKYGRTGWCNTAGCVNNVNVAGTWVPARGEWIRDPAQVQIDDAARERERIANWFTQKGDIWRSNNATNERCEYDRAAQMVRDSGGSDARWPQEESVSDPNEADCGG